MQIQAFLIDIEGTVIDSKGGLPLPGSVEWINRLRSKNIPFVFATNITTDSPSQVETALKDMGFNIDLNHIHSPLTVLKSWLKRDAFGDTYVRGTSRLKKFLLEQGVRIVESDDAKTVVFGWDAEIDLRAMSIATKAILDRGARFIALHENRLYRDQQGYPCPGVGAFVRAIEYATGVQAEIVGKPSILYFQYALERLGVSPDNSVMVGDDPFGDLTGAKKTGMKTVLVLTGKYKNSKILEKLPSALKPDLVLENISSLSQEYFP